MLIITCLYKSHYETWFLGSTSKSPARKQKAQKCKQTGKGRKQYLQPGSRIQHQEPMCSNHIFTTGELRDFKMIEGRNWAEHISGRCVCRRSPKCGGWRGGSSGGVIACSTPSPSCWSLKINNDTSFCHTSPPFSFSLWHHHECWPVQVIPAQCPWHIILTCEPLHRSLLPWISIRPI